MSNVLSWFNSLYFRDFTYKNNTNKINNKVFDRQINGNTWLWVLDNKPLIKVQHVLLSTAPLFSDINEATRSLPKSLPLISALPEIPIYSLEAS